ncbi:platelet-activating factor receptor-like [Pempheris klunzingeri]|uniref:platelet-activating factor receptor-like n=1 Tax=Pempheris klunzingeri TaxID=3127111 RepID=UPI00397EEF9D
MADSSTVTTTVPVLISVTGNLTGNTTTPTAVRVANVISWVTFSIGLPTIGLAIYTLKNLSKGENKVPMHVIFLLVSDVISFFGRPHVDQNMESGTHLSPSAFNFIFYFGVISNVTLMLYIAQERHLLVAYPQCLACCSSIRRSPVVALVAWAAPFAVLALAMLQCYLWFAVCLLTPFPFLLFFAVDSWRVLLCSRSIPPSFERKKAVWGISAIWANYTLLYVPFILSVLLQALSFKKTVTYLGLVSQLLLYLSPLVDPFLYIFMTKGLKEVLQALPCRQKPSRKENTVDTVAETVETRL